MYQPNKNHLLIGVAVLAILITGGLIFFNSYGPSSGILSFIGPSGDVVAQRAIDYINANELAGQGQVVSLDSVSQESGLVKIGIKIGGNTIYSYATRDGKLLFPQGLTLDSSATKQTAANQVTPATVAKVDNTLLETYVVSGCPFGIQVQRALSNAIKSIPALAEYVKVRYIGGVLGNTITAMHGDEEAQENLRQICLRDEQPAKYWGYVDCYIKKAAGKAANGMPYGDSKSCQTETGVDSAKLNACVSDPARGLAFAQEDFALSAQYNATGSPTLVLNGQTISEDAFGGRSADAMRNIVCSSSKTEPEFCSTKLDTAPATTSFSLTATTSASSATAAANNNCAPATN